MECAVPWSYRKNGQKKRAKFCLTLVDWKISTPLSVSGGELPMLKNTILSDYKITRMAESNNDKKIKGIVKQIKE